jgi:excisionase family DNA binding protein
MRSLEKTDELLTRAEAAAFLRVRPETLAVWASTQRYHLPYIRVGRAVRYRRCDLDAFVTARTVGAGSVEA